ncbi:MAG: TetR/AcrR family transcriptional regulator [Leptospirales bacterium]|nr:TetR/AcrR family transcriptional regulator [Leptospirales bacterium]
MARDIEENYILWMDAFLRLMQKENYFDISVEDIAREAGMSRVGFYNYFPDKEELLWKTYRYVFMEVETKVTSMDPTTLLSDGKPLTYYVFENVKKNRAFFRNLFCEGMPFEFQAKLTDYIAKESFRTHEDLRKKYRRTDFPYFLINEYLTGALLAVLRSILSTDAEWDSERLSEFFTALAAPGILSMLANQT